MAEVVVPSTGGPIHSLRSRVARFALRLTVRLSPSLFPSRPQDTAKGDEDMTTSSKERFDVYGAITDQIIAAIEAGAE